jgi:hypothetical protein
MFRHGRLMLLVLAVVALGALAAPVASMALTRDPCGGKGFGEGQLVWREGETVPICVNPEIPPAEAGRGNYRTSITYLVAPVDPGAPLDPGVTDPPFIPQHDNVAAWDLGGYGRRAACLGFYVVRGPFATPETVHSRVDPKGASGQPGASGVIELAYEIDLGAGFVPLRSTDVIELGVVRGLLSLVQTPFPPGEAAHPGSCWIGKRSER